MDLSDRIISLTITDQNDNDLLSANTGDTFTVNGIVSTINGVYFGDVVTINGVPQTLVTLYGIAGTTATAVTIPVVDGKLVPAYAGSMTSTSYVNSSSDFVINIDDITCFTSGTLIRTKGGLVAVEKLQIGDEIATVDSGFQALRWVGSTQITAQDLRRNPKLLPVRIRAGVLGDGIPARDLVVSQQHRILVRSKIAVRMFGKSEILVAAKQLLSIPGIEIAADVERVEYFHLLFDRHEIIYSENAATESLYTGAEAMKSIGASAREEIYTLFPELRSNSDPASARTLVSGRMGRQLAMRHAKNEAALTS
ncbi:Hint domain-containing protein [Paracoccus laeviglucosivorans]|uniref:Hint domain-containing protein n=1 Tax=Paracoccus laeviglucosivorans TaxID=1197861 RepID=A0A521FU12_9RHOB|nr:Hint domain-containing protein [Paracoccus laeviglucosivorans]SMO99060.1 Hint domain-containing protein [Paracoccus laeviglucosivorans]